MIRSTFGGFWQDAVSSAACPYGDVWSTIRHLESIYPGFESWFHSKVLAGERTDNRKLLLKRIGDRVVGVAIAKRESTEKKLCTLWVAPEARAQGIAKLLAEEVFEWLATDKPLFTIPEERLPEFQGLLSLWNFQQTQKLAGVYRPGKSEYVFNGSLTLRS